MGKFFNKEHLIPWFSRNERRLTSLALIAGFIFDNLTLTRIDMYLDNLILMSYLLIAGTGIAFINLYEGGAVRGKFFERLHLFLPVVVQFAFGGLFSGFVVFYMRSSSLMTGSVFVLLLGALLIGNEFFKKHYTRLTFQMSLFFFALFSFFIFFIPVLVGSIGPEVFLLSGAVSVGSIFLFIYTLSHFIPARIEEGKKMLRFSVTAIFCLINFFYFTNVIPPIPLSLKDAGVYNKVERSPDGNYLAYVGERKFSEFFRIQQVIEKQQNSPLFFYSAVFAPTSLDTEIAHHWQYFDPAKKAWVTVSRIQFPISGGRDGGYRGYSVKENIPAGLWRVDVKTSRGQIIGRMKFVVKEVVEEPILESIVL